MSDKSPRAVVLLSGGIDSATTLAVAKSEGLDIHALTFQYGQRHGTEIEAARRIAESLSVACHSVFPIDLRQWGGSALTSDMPVPKGEEGSAPTVGIPVTYVPARNTVFLSLALALAEATSAPNIFIGANSQDDTGYPDCRPEYMEAFERVANLGTKLGTEDGVRVSVRAPLIGMNKTEIVRLGLSLGVDYSLTRSCYDPAHDGAACGRCDACRLRTAAFAANGVPDPIPYQDDNHR